MNHERVNDGNLPVYEIVQIKPTSDTGVIKNFGRVIETIKNYLLMV